MYPQLDQQILQLTMPFQFARQFAVTRSIAGQPGNTYIFPKQAGLRSAVFSEIGEGAFIPMDSTPYSYAGVTVYKTAEGFIVSRELLEDTPLPVVQDHMVRFGIRFANKVDKDVWNAIIAGAATSTAANGNTLGATGTVFGAYRTGAIGQEDVNLRIADITQVNYLPDYLGLHPINEMDLYTLPTFSQAFAYGAGHPLAIREGVITPQPPMPVQGLTPIVSTNVPAGTAVVLSSAMAQNVLRQYAPGIFFVEKRPLMTATEDVPSRDAQAVYFTARYAPSVQIGAVISLVTGLATS